MKRYFWVLAVIFLTSNICFAATRFKPAAPGQSLEYRYFQIAKVGVGGDEAIDVNKLTWYDITTGENHTRWFIMPDEWSGWMQFQFYAHGKDGNDPNDGQFDVNCIGANTYGGGKIYFKSTVLIGNQQLSHDPNSGLPFRISALPDPNNKWANADANFADLADTAVGRSGYSGTTSTDGILRYSIIPLDKFYRVEIRHISPASKVDYIYCVVTGGKK